MPNSPFYIATHFDTDHYILAHNSITYSFVKKYGLTRKGGRAPIGFNHALSYCVKNVALGSQSQQQKQRPMASVFSTQVPGTNVLT